MLKLPFCQKRKRLGKTSPWMIACLQDSEDMDTLMRLPDLTHSNLRSLEICSAIANINGRAKEFNLLRLLQAPKLERLHVQCHLFGCNTHILDQTALCLPEQGYKANDFQAVNKDCEIVIIFPAWCIGNIDIGTQVDLLCSSLGLKTTSTSPGICLEICLYREAAIPSPALGHLATELEETLGKPLTFLLDAISLYQGKDLPSEKMQGAYQNYVDLQLHRSQGWLPPSHVKLQKHASRATFLDT